MTNDGAPSQTRDESLPLPDKFFEAILPRIDDLAQLKLALHLLRVLGQKPADRRFLQVGELAENKALRSFVESPDELEAILDRLVELGALQVSECRGRRRDTAPLHA